MSMETTTDPLESTTANSPDSHHHHHMKVIKDEQPPQKPDNHVDTGWTESSVSLSRSPEFFMETLGGKSVAVGDSAEQPIEELTVDNYKGEGSAGKRGLWGNFTRLKKQAAPVQLEQQPSYSKVSDLLVKSDGRIASRQSGIGIRTKVLSSAGFPQFMVKTNLRGKGVAYAQQQQQQQKEKRVNVVRENCNAEVDSKVKGMKDDGGCSLREWLMPGRHKLDKVERMHIFKQILDLVDTWHSQGFALQNLRPSYLSITSGNQVRYVGSFVNPMEQGINQDTNCMEQRLKRKRCLEYGAENNGGLSLKQQRHGESYNTFELPSSATVSGYVCQQSSLEFLKLEEKWYACPEVLNDGACPLSSNIYSLGVLLFELFCYFETWELHSAAMYDLRYRILPPSFLSESPKEAGFCLWLLHPEPSSRPNSRDILLCDLISEGKDLSSLDQSAASIDEEDTEADLLLHFLLNMKEQKEKQAAKLVADAGCLKADIEEVERRYSSRTEFLSDGGRLLTNFSGISDTYPQKGSIHVEGTSKSFMPSVNEERMMRNIDPLENAYFSLRSKIELSETGTPARSDIDALQIRDKCSQVQNDATISKESTDPLGSFFEGLCKYARYSRFEVCGTLRSVDILNSANVICSLSFDRDEDYFAAAGVSKKIKIFEFGALLNDSVDIHYPLIEMSSKSKLSCVCWNNYIKNYLASTDYDGVVQLWDASTGQGFTQYTEHQKRAWSVDFSQVDPTKLASGSDDCTVKLWSINEKNCTDTIRNVANVCCVQFSSHSSNMLAFGSADYKIYCYDLRNTRIPWCTLSGHGKAVSYVKFVDSETVVSASTDNTLKLWDLKKTSSMGLSTDACSMSLSGHTNEKNFVGLSVSDGYIACGSESNEVYAYYRTLPMPITSHKFGSIDPITGQETTDDNGQFVSSVCWRTKSNMVVAANSTGSIKLLQMV